LGSGHVIKLSSHARRTPRTLMTRAGVEADHAESALCHPGRSGVYDRAGYRDEKRRAFEAVAARLDLILNPRIEW
jgi:hypothetical protein